MHVQVKQYFVSGIAGNVTNCFFFIECAVNVRIRLGVVRCIALVFSPRLGVVRCITLLFSPRLKL